MLAKMCKNYSGAEVRGTLTAPSHTNVLNYPGAEIAGLIRNAASTALNRGIEGKSSKPSADFKPTVTDSSSPCIKLRAPTSTGVGKADSASSNGLSDGFSLTAL